MPCQTRPWTCRLAGSSTKASGTSKTSSTSARSGTGAEAGVDEPDEGRDGEVGHRLVQVERAEHLDLAGREPDLLLGLAQRRGERRRVGRLLLAAGEGDLAGVVLEQRGAAGEDQVEPAAALDQRHQHRGGPERPRAGPRRRRG